MKKQALFLTIVIALFSSLNMRGQFTREQAIDLVLNQLLVEDLNTIDVYASYGLKNDTSKLVLKCYDTLGYPYSSNWLFFVDDKPFANWHHSCRYIFVNAENGEYTILNEKTIYPLELSDKFELISVMPNPNPDILASQEPPIIIPAEPDPHLYAVIIVGVDDPVNNRFWNDVSALYTTLITKYGYEKDNIFVHFSEGFGVTSNDLDGPPPSNDIDFPAYQDDLRTTFKNLAGDWHNNPSIPELEDDDQLFIFIDDHGDTDFPIFSHAWIDLPLPPSGGTVEDAILRDDTLASWIKNIHCAQMIFLFQQCYGGGFADDLFNYTLYDVKCKNRLFYSAANYNEPSVAEMHITNKKYCEFTFYWVAAVRGNFPFFDGNLPVPWRDGFPLDPFPFSNAFTMCTQQHIYNNPDSDGDGTVQMNEAFDYANWNDSSSDDPLGGFYCNALTESPQSLKNVGIQGNIESLCGLIGKIDITQTAENRSYVVGGPLIVSNEAILTFPSNTQPISQMYFINEQASLIVDNGATLNPGSGMIFAGELYNSILINGNIGSLINVTFKSNSNDPSNQNFSGIFMNNPTIHTIMDNVYFNHSGFGQMYGDLTINNNSYFTNCKEFFCYRGNVNISNSHFIGTSIYLNNLNMDHSLTATINNNSFYNSNNTPNVDAIDLNNFDNFLIQDNIIGNTIYSGIGVYDAGHGVAGNQNIVNNQISNSGIGITAYNSVATIQNNHIHDNDIGTKLLNNSNIALIGNSSASKNSETQEIINNSSYEVLACDYSFPYFIRYNAIIDEDNNGNPLDPIIFNDNDYLPYYYKIDIQYNCWGNNFNPIEDLRINYGTYKIYPTWCPGNYDQESPEADELMYLDAVAQFDSSNFNQAKSIFQLLIQQYPKSSYSQAAIKNLFCLEKFAGNDYADLKQYYHTNDSIVADSTLVKIGDFFANSCDIELKNWIDVITWYENKIQNPENSEDSIFAIIDLGNIYLLMENESEKSSYYIGSLPQYKPSSKQEFLAYRDSLLKLLPVDHMNNDIKDHLLKLNFGELLQNIPNPFSFRSDIYYKLPENTNTVTIIIIDCLGKIRKTIPCYNLSKGIHKVEVNASDLSTGIYFYCLEIDGSIKDKKIMIISK